MSRSVTKGSDDVSRTILLFDISVVGLVVISPVLQSPNRTDKQWSRKIFDLCEGAAGVLDPIKIKRENTLRFNSLRYVGPIKCLSAAIPGSFILNISKAFVTLRFPLRLVVGHPVLLSHPGQEARESRVDAGIVRKLRNTGLGGIYVSAWQIP